MSNFTFLQTEWPGLLDAASDGGGGAENRHRESMAELEALFASLQHRALKEGL